jgi:hypothetical protein
MRNGNNKSVATNQSPQVPNPRAPGYCEISQHNLVSGTVVKRGATFFAFDHREVLLGKFANLAAALKAFRPIIFDDETV